MIVCTSTVTVYKASTTLLNITRQVNNRTRSRRLGLFSQEIPSTSNVVRLMGGVRLMINETNKKGMFLYTGVDLRQNFW